MRVFLVPLLADDDADDIALSSAAGQAGSVGGAIIGLFVRPDPTEALSTLVEGASPSTIRAMTRAVSDGLEERSRRARAALAEVARHAGLGETEARLVEPVGDFTSMLAVYGRLADAIVLAGDVGGGGLRQRAIESALFQATRPVLVLKEAMMAPPRRLLVAWNGSPEAARAVQAALPWLRSADEVHVAGAGSPRHEPQGPEALSTFLKAHDIDARSHTLGDGAVGESLLATVRDLGADCLVMGGYGRSRMQEMIFGGVTRYVLLHRTTAILIAH